MDAAAEKLGVRSGVWTYDWIRKHSLARMREIPHYVQFGAHLKFAVAEGLCDLNPKRKPKGTYWPEWVDGSDRDGYFRSITPGWQQERIEADGYASPEVYHDVQRAAAMAMFE